MNQPVAIAALWSIFLLHWVVLVTPGVNFILIANLGAGTSRKAACCCAAGVCVGTAVWATCAVLGAGVVFQAFPAMRAGIQAFGAGYIVYVAVRLLRGGPGAASHALAGVSSLSAFRMGMVTNLLNPKPVFFFGSIFVTLLPSDAPAGLMAACVAVAVANALAWHLLLAVVFSSARMRAGYLERAGLLARLAGAVLGAMGLWMLVRVAGEVRSVLLRAP